MNDNQYEYDLTDLDISDITQLGSDFRKEYDPRPIINYIFDVLFEGFNEYADDAPEFI